MRKALLYLLCSFFAFGPGSLPFGESGAWGGCAFAQCNLAASTSQINILCNGVNTATASVTASAGNPPYTYNWSTGASTSSISNLSVGTYTVSVIDASCILSGVELVNNGNFSAGNTGFVSAYTFTPPPNTGEGQYWVAPGSSVTGWNGGMFSLGDHTSGAGNFMIVNGAGTPGSNVWCQTIPVTPNTTYNFSTWVSSLNNSSPAMLQFSTNGVPLGPVFNAPATWGPWQQFFSVWNSGANTSVTICVENMNTTLGGNDFGLDDISFMSCTPCTVTTAVTITQPPPLNITAATTDEFCNRADGTATVNALGGNGAYTYLWTPSAQNSATATGLVAGNYSVTVTDANGCTHDTAMVVNFTPGPSANAGADVSMCSKKSISLSASGGGNYLWSPAGGLSNASIANPAVSQSVSTTYTVTVSDVNGCTSSDDVLVTVSLSPEISFTATSACFNNATTFIGQSIGNNITQWNWDFGDPASGVNNTSVLQNPSHQYIAPGVFNVTLIGATAAGCTDTFKLNVTVYQLPKAAFSSTTVCIGTITTLTDLSTVTGGNVTGWNWNFGDPASGVNNVSNLQNPTHLFTTAGTFSVLLTATSNNNCQSSISISVIVLPPPLASFTVAPSCLNSATSFTDASTNATNWNWAFGDGGVSNIQNPSHTYLAYGTYTVTLIAASTGSCADTITDTVTVYPLPVVSFLSDTVCLGDTASFLNLSFIPAGSIASWHWDFGDGDTSIVKDPTHAYVSAGNYTVTLSATSAMGCSASATMPALVYPLPNADFSTDPVMTDLIDPVYFTDLSSGGVVQWWWEFGDADTDIVQDPSHLYSDTGMFVITLVVTSNVGCVDTVRHTIEVRDFAFYIPNTFSPNGDDINELFFGKGVGITEYEITIFDRWGNRIFYCKVNDLPQSLPCLWDGKVQSGISNKIAQQDVYVYRLNFTNVFGKQFDYIGNVTVIR